MGELKQLIVSSDDAGSRLDLFVSRASDLSREQVKKLIRSGHILVNQSKSKPSYKTRSGDRISIDLPPPTPLDLTPEAIDIDLIYSDPHLIVINKPAGLVVHPGAGVSGGTLVNALLSMFDDLPGIGGVERPGIVHRLDRDTSGVMVVAKTDLAHRRLVKQFSERITRKSYLALVCGVPKEDEIVVNMPIGRSISNRKKMSVNAVSAREAITEVRVERRFERFALVEARPKTGRTHQIRVHLSYLGHPIVGDPIYGGGKRRAIKEANTEAIANAMRNVQRQMLHAKSLGFYHPGSGEWMEFSAEIPPDMRNLIGVLEGR